MNVQFEFGSSVRPKTKKGALILDIGGVRNWGDPERLIDGHWPGFYATSYEWLKTAKLGDARVFDLTPETRAAIVVAQETTFDGREWSPYKAKPAAVEKGLAALAKQVEPPIHVHVNRIGGPQHPKGLWKIIEDALARAFLSRKVPVTVYDDYIRAIADGDLDAVKALVAAGADPNKRSDGGHLPLSWAIHNAKRAEDIVRYFLEIGVKRYDELLVDALTTHRNEDKLAWLVEQLLEEGDRKLVVPTILRSTVHVPYARRLIELGAKADAIANDDGSTPLHLAARFGDKEIIDLLMDHGASLKVKDKERKTPLDYALDWRRNDMVKLLKKKLGAKPFDWTKAEKDLYDAAVQELGRIAKKHKSTTFSAFAFECDVGNGSMLVKLNEASHAFSTKYTLSGDFTDGFEAIDSDKRVRMLFNEASGSEDRCRRVVDMVYRVAVRMEQEDAFSQLQRSDDFQVMVSDAHEMPAAALARLERVRREAGVKTKPTGAKKKEAAVPKKPTPNAAAEKKTPSAGGAAGKTVHLEFREGTSQKFWEIEVQGKKHTVTFGRIGSPGQSKTKSFSSPDAAQSDADKLVAEKRKKGYR